MPLMNYGIVRDAGANRWSTLHRCAQPDRAAWQTLRILGVQCALKLSSEEEYSTQREAIEAGAGVVVQSVPTGTFNVNAPDTIRTAATLHALLEIGPTVVHCVHGRDRTGLVVAAYRLIYNDWTLKATLEERAKYGVVGIIAVFDHEITETIIEIAHQQGVTE